MSIHSIKSIGLTPNVIDQIIYYHYRLYFQHNVLGEIRDALQKERYNYLVKGLRYLFRVHRGYIKPSEIKFNPIYFRRTDQFLHTHLLPGNFVIEIHIANYYMYLRDALYFRDPILYEEHKWSSLTRLSRIFAKNRKEYAEFNNCLQDIYRKITLINKNLFKEV